MKTTRNIVMNAPQKLDATLAQIEASSACATFAAYSHVARATT